MKISEESVILIKKHLSELDLVFPLDDEHGGYKILKFFEHMDGNIGHLRMSNDKNDKRLLDDVNRVIMEFNNPNEPIDYEDLERRLKS